MNRLKNVVAIPLAGTWNEIRQIRNRLTHEFPDALEDNAENVNRIVDSLDDLTGALDQAEGYAQELASCVSSERSAR